MRTSKGFFFLINHFTMFTPKNIALAVMVIIILYLLYINKQKADKLNTKKCSCNGTTNGGEMPSQNGGMLDGGGQITDDMAAGDLTTLAGRV